MPGPLASPTGNYLLELLHGVDLEGSNIINVFNTNISEISEAVRSGIIIWGDRDTRKDFFSVFWWKMLVLFVWICYVPWQEAVRWSIRKKRRPLLPFNCYWTQKVVEHRVQQVRKSQHGAEDLKLINRQWEMTRRSGQVSRRTRTAAAQKFTKLIQVRACKDPLGKRVLCRNILVDFFVWQRYTAF